MDHRAMIQRSLDYIEENLRTEITAAELAEMAHLKPEPGVIPAQIIVSKTFAA